MYRYLFIALFFVNVQLAQANRPIPHVPQHLQMMGVKLTLTPDIQKQVKKEIEFLAEKRSAVDSKLAKMAIYFPVIEDIFEQNNVPTAFKYLCAQESSFIADAVSSSNAVGFWQFKDGTALDYGLRVDDLIDERKNIVSSTTAAAKYLTKSNKVFNNWFAAMLSYRIGLTGAKNIVPANWYGASAITIDREVDWYVVRNIAYYIFFESEMEHFKPNSNFLYLYTNAAGKSFLELGNELNESPLELKKQNTWCKADQIPEDRKYTLALLTNKARHPEVPVIARRNNNYASDAIENTAGTGSVVVFGKEFFDIEVGYPKLEFEDVRSLNSGNKFYKINGKKGVMANAQSTIKSLAEAGKITMEHFMTYNNISAKEPLLINMVYYLEKKYKKAKRAEKHVVKRGQTTWFVSQMYGVDKNKLLKMNRMLPNEVLQEGRVLLLDRKRGKHQAIEYVAPMFQVEVKPENNKVIVDGTPGASLPVPKENTPKDVPVVAPKPQEDPVASSPAKEIKVITQEIKKTTEPTFVYGKHKVAAGETLYSISNKYDITVAELQRFNNFNEFSTIKLGEYLWVTENASSVIKSNTNVPEISTPTTNTKLVYEVKAGDTLMKISRFYGITTEEIRKFNKMPDYTLKVGQLVYIPEKK
jgi:membrane-bound lytic murein transglycosylase D